MSSKRIEKIELSDGSYMTYEQIIETANDIKIFATNNNIDFSDINNIRQNENLMGIYESSWTSELIA